ncbi:hypothetical protein [Rhizobium halophilum]|uniref:hypothetical protein n=1 Tax=Rhizobium halophilum TaxID=2846852 RepID=UPI001EFE1F14|nr:hypothetical protein [Rhizobium halophilum]MCF6369018.1 hypothetical protein [Rhizobium halophilum]
MSSDASPRSSLLPRLMLVVGAVAFLSACQARPLYSQTSGTGAKLAEITFAKADDRVEQTVRNHLIFLTSGGEGDSLLPQYQVGFEVVSSYNDILDDEDAEGLKPGRVILRGSYTLVRISDGLLLKTGNRHVTSLLDVSQQEFAELRAVRDAEDRAARELAEIIRADLAIALAREPQPQVTWQK